MCFIILATVIWPEGVPLQSFIAAQPVVALRGIISIALVASGVALWASALRRLGKGPRGLLTTEQVERRITDRRDQERRETDRRRQATDQATRQLRGTSETVGAPAEGERRESDRRKVSLDLYELGQVDRRKLDRRQIERRLEERREEERRLAERRREWAKSQ